MNLLIHRVKSNYKSKTRRVLERALLIVKTKRNKTKNKRKLLKLMIFNYLKMLLKPKRVPEKIQRTRKIRVNLLTKLRKTKRKRRKKKRSRKQRKRKANLKIKK